MPDISEAPVLVFLETVGNGKTVVNLITRLTAGRYVSDPIGKCESCWQRRDICRFTGRNWGVPAASTPSSIWGSALRRQQTPSSLRLISWLR